jgi:predicted O-methyltransferase YrrM
MLHRPRTIIDFGVLHGYSTIAMALALKDLGRGKVIGYDLWDKYPYKKAYLKDTWANIEKAGVANYVELKEGDFKDFKENDYQFFHLDISNTGEIIDELEAKTRYRRTKGAVVVFEGGSEERDQVEWLISYNKKPIRQTKASFKVINPLFPSLSKLCD